MNDDVRNAYRVEIDNDLDRTIDELCALVRQPSVSSSGLGIDDCARHCAELLERYRFRSELLSCGGPPVVVGERGTGARTLLLYCHYDTQPPGPFDRWTSPPFEPSRRDGRLYGRGMLDDKGHIVSRLAAIDAYVRRNGEPPFRIVFLLEGEEEIGSPHLGPFLEAHAHRLRADGCIWEYGEVDEHERPVFYLGVRGSLSVELEVNAANVDVHSGVHSHIPNAAWRLVWALSTLKSPDERIQLDDFYEHVQPPTPRQLELLAALPDTERDDRERYGIQEFAGGLTGHALRASVFAPTCSISGLTAGFQGEGVMTVIPHQASAKLDFRLAPGQDPDQVHQSLRRHLDEHGFADVVTRSSGGLAAATADPDDPFIRPVLDSAADVYSEPAVIHPIIGGSGPMAMITSALAAPVVVGVGIGRPGGLSHAPDEHIHVAELVRGTEHMASALERIAVTWTASGTEVS